MMDLKTRDKHVLDILRNLITNKCDSETLAITLDNLSRDNNFPYGLYNVSDIINHHLRKFGLVNALRFSYYLHKSTIRDINNYHMAHAHDEIKISNTLNNFFRHSFSSYCCISNITSGSYNYFYVLRYYLIYDLRHHHLHDAQRESKLLSNISEVRDNDNSTSSKNVLKSKLDIKPVNPSKFLTLANDIYFDVEKFLINKISHSEANNRKSNA